MSGTPATSRSTDMSTLRSPITGETLVLNAGAWSGVYRGTETDPPPPPANDVAPAFTAIPTQVGGLARVYAGDWSPPSVTTTVHIGYGATAATFVPVGEPGTEKTLTSEFAGQRLSARVTARNGTLAGPPIWIDSGQDISGTDTNWPADIDPSAWDATEITDEAPEGRRLISVNSSVTVPSGYLLKLYSGNEDGGLPTTAAATITPGAPYTTIGSLLVGTTCFNSLAWLRQSDAAIQRAHGPRTGNTTDQQKSFVMVGLDEEPPPPADSDFTPNVTVSTIAAVRSAAAAKIALGFSSDDDYVIGLNASTSGVFDLTGLVNNHATRTTKRIIVRHVGTFTEAANGHPACSVKHTGALRFTNSRGIWGALLNIQTNSGSAITDAGSDLCGLTYCFLVASTAQTTTIPNGIDYIFRQTGANFTLSHCLLRGGKAGGILLENVGGPHPGGTHEIGCMIEYVEVDEHKAYWNVDNSQFVRNWGCRRRAPKAPGTNPHYDYWQTQGLYHRNNLNYGNVILQQIGGGIVNQVFFHRFEAGPDPTDWLYFEGTRWEQNLSFTGLGQELGGAHTPGIGIRYNTSITCGDPGLAVGAVIEALAPRDYNYVAVAGASSAQSGPNGLSRNTGFSVDTNGDGKADDVIRTYSAIAGDFEFGIPWMSDTATGNPMVAEASQTLKAFQPKVGTRLHWNHPNPVGAYLRSRELFDRDYRETVEATVGYKVIPHAWPVLPAWRHMYNRDGWVDDDYTGSYDANGNPA